MLTSMLIGSILAISGGGELNSHKIEIIQNYSDNKELSLLNTYDFPTIVYELANYDNYFTYSNNCIKICEQCSSVLQLKKKFFDILDESDKDIIYELINLL